MKTLVKLAAATGLCLIAFGQAQAGSGHDRQGGYSRHGEIQIHNRHDSGKISHQEARRLAHQQRAIRQLKRAFYEDGYLSRKERKILAYRISQLNHRSHDYKHNDNYRVPKGYWNNGHSRSYIYGHVDSRPSGTIIYRW